MQRCFVTIVLALVLLAGQGCAQLGLDSPYSRDPLTGGEDTSTSQLLQVKLPAGMQRYSSHGRQEQGSAGTQGLEVLRGSGNMNQAIQFMYTVMSAKGWKLRLNSQVQDRAINVYWSTPRFAVLAFRKQGTMTILEIWVGTRLADGATPVFANSGDGYGSGQGRPGRSGRGGSANTNVGELPGEEYSPLGKGGQNGGLDDGRTVYRGASGGKAERWGSGSQIQERDL